MEQKSNIQIQIQDSSIQFTLNTRFKVNYLLVSFRKTNNIDKPVIKLIKNSKMEEELKLPWQTNG